MRLGVSITREDGHNYVKINSNDYEKIEEALETQLGIDCGQWGFQVEDQHRVKSVLRRLFDNHSEFYEYFGFDAGIEHGGTGQGFNTGGWQTFLQDAFNHSYIYRITDEDDLQLFCDVIAKRLKEALEEYDDELIPDDENFVAKSTVSVDAEPSGRLTDPEMLEDAIVIGNDQAFKLNVAQVEDAETLDDVKDQVENDTKEVYERQVTARVDTLKQRVNRLQDKLEEERQEMLVKGLQMVNDLDDWKVEDGRLVYTETINLETVQVKSDDENPKELTEEAKEKFYIDGLSVPIRKKISKPSYEDAYHPHALSVGTCTGSFRADMSKEGLQDVVEQFKQADLHDTNHTEAERDLKDNWEEYVKTDEDGDPVEEEVWEA